MNEKIGAPLMSAVFRRVTVYDEITEKAMI